jgi:hypothetical protein
MSYLKWRQFISSGKSRSCVGRADSSRPDNTNVENAMENRRAEMEAAASMLKKSLELENQLNSSLRRKIKYSKADLEQLRECRRTVENCAEVYLSAVRRWRLALLEEVPAGSQTTRTKGDASATPVWQS